MKRNCISYNTLKLYFLYKKEIITTANHSSILTEKSRFSQNSLNYFYENYFQKLLLKMPQARVWFTRKRIVIQNPSVVTMF